MNSGFARIALALALLCSLGPNLAQAAIFHPAPVTIGGNTWSATPSFIDSWYASNSNTDVGPQNPTNVGNVLGSAFGIPLTFVSGGSCGAGGVGCTSLGDKNNGGTWSGPAATVIGVHFDNQFIAFLFSAGITSFNILNLPNGVSNIYAYDPVATPLPGALLLMASALAGWFGFSRWGGTGRSTSAC